MDAPEGYLYHFSPPENRESIQREGLMTGSDGMIWYTASKEEFDPDTQYMDRWLVDVRGLELQNEEIAPGMWFYTQYEEIPPWRLTLDKPQADWKQASAPSWKDKYNYREATGKQKCGSCDALSRGKCLMFSAKVEDDMTCDEWTDKPTWRLGSAEDEEEGEPDDFKPSISWHEINPHTYDHLHSELVPTLPSDDDDWMEDDLPVYRKGSQQFDEEGNPIYNITNGDDVMQGIPLDMDDPDPNIFQWVPPKRTNDREEALEDLRDGGYRWNIEKHEKPEMWRLQHRREPISHDISTRDLQLKGYQVIYNDPYLPRAPASATGPKEGFYHLYDSKDPAANPGRIWATQRVDDIPDWEEPEPGALNEPWTRERMPDLWQKHWGTEDSDVTAALAPVGVPFETYAKFVMKGQWADIQAKAKRLIMENKVTLLVNTPSSIVAHVVGDGSDNGGTPDEHEVEISRDDPDSNVITQSICDCKWNQYRWDRTKKWKKWEGRVCSHILASFWKSKSTPIDITDLEPGTEYQTPVGQKGPTAQPGQLQIPVPKATPMTHEPLVNEPQATPAPTAQPLPSTGDMVGNPPSNPWAPAAPQRSPKTPQRQQLQLFNINPDPSVQTTPPAGGFSQPGQAPPDPENVQMPGTFSSWHQAIVDIGACARCGGSIGQDGYCMQCGQYNDEFGRPQRVPRFPQGMPEQAEQAEWQANPVEWGVQVTANTDWTDMTQKAWEFIQSQEFVMRALAQALELNPEGWHDQKDEGFYDAIIDRIMKDPGLEPSLRDYVDQTNERRTKKIEFYLPSAEEWKEILYGIADSMTDPRGGIFMDFGGFDMQPGELTTREDLLHPSDEKPGGTTFPGEWSE